jgi:hypothetical protein
MVLSRQTSHPLHWIIEPLLEDPTYVEKAMFGCRACYLHGKMKLVLASQGEPWQGLLICTAHEHHASLLAQYRGLKKHPVLGKWLYLPEDHDTFESSASQLLETILSNDLRIGVAPSKKKRRVAKKLKTS